LPLDEVIEYIDGVDIVFTEGYKRESKIKIEVFRQAACETPLCCKEELLAVASDTVIHEGVPHFDVNDAAAMADFLEMHVLKR